MGRERDLPREEEGRGRAMFRAWVGPQTSACSKGPPSECEIGRRLGEAGRDRKTMEREEQDVWFHLHM